MKIRTISNRFPGTE